MSEPIGTKESCVCEGCVNCCKNKPGWFRPDQVPALLEHFGVDSVKDLIGPGKMAIDYHLSESGDPNVFILSPNIVGNEGDFIPFKPYGQCVFLKEDRCSIHATKPFECAESLHDTASAGVTHADIVSAWRGNPMLQDYHSQYPEPSLDDMLGMDELGDSDVGED